MVKKMATQQPITWFSEITGFARETVKKRLDAAGLVPTPGAHNAALYETRDALPALYEVPQGGDQGELMRARCRNLDLDSELKRQRHAVAAGTLIDAKTVERVWSGMTGAARQHLLSLPYRLATNCYGGDFATIETKARELIYEALTNLSKFDPRDYLADPPALATESESALSLMAS